MRLLCIPGWHQISTDKCLKFVCLSKYKTDLNSLVPQGHVRTHVNKASTSRNLSRTLKPLLCFRELSKKVIKSVRSHEIAEWISHAISPACQNFSVSQLQVKSSIICCCQVRLRYFTITTYKLHTNKITSLHYVVYKGYLFPPLN